ncbi:MAG: hypothetical protein SGI88_05665 [Candidatus Hydrogenedentes bacterium]|nr:hypothetical protein [Candidatus Hydrogenedentota bacterium]
MQNFWTRSAHRNYAVIIFIAALVCSIASFAADSFEEAPIHYSATEAHNTVSELKIALDAKPATLEYDAMSGYLASLLDALKIPHESQVLVFSKTSLQTQHISPSTPRAIYFNDDTYVGSVPNGEVIEISVADPQLGAVFYTVSQEQSERPAVIRQTENCLQCHGSTLTRGIPGHLVRSVFANADGFPILKAGTHVTTQASPMEERWGGWYVTGNHGAARHMGNVLAVETERDASIDVEAGANRRMLDARVNPGQYLTPHSDVVALMVLVHQVDVHNLFTTANFETRFAQHRQAAVDEILKRDLNIPGESTQRIIKNVGDKLVEYLLFANEAPLKSPMTGTSGFMEAFPQQGPRDSQGRSLREFDLQTRMFKYPLSYLIYSQAFDSLPKPMKEYVYRSLWDHLTGAVESRLNAHLNIETRNAIRQIVVETKPNLPEFWK